MALPPAVHLAPPLTFCSSINGKARKQKKRNERNHEQRHYHDEVSLSPRYIFTCISLELDVYLSRNRRRKKYKSWSHGNRKKPAKKRKRYASLFLIARDKILAFMYGVDGEGGKEESTYVFPQLQSRFMVISHLEPVLLPPATFNMFEYPLIARLLEVC